MKNESGTRELNLSIECTNPRCKEGMGSYSAYESYIMGKFPYTETTLPCGYCKGTYSRKLELDIKKDKGIIK